MKKRITKKLIKRATHIHLHMSLINHTAIMIAEMYDIWANNKTIEFLDKNETSNFSFTRSYKEFNKATRRGNTIHLYEKSVFK